MCNQHVEQELDFMLDVVREGAGLAELLPCPNPTKVNGQKDRYIDRQTYRQIDKQTDGLIVRVMDGQIDREVTLKNIYKLLTLRFFMFLCKTDKFLCFSNKRATL